jgi:hypothetical protein
MGHHFVSRCQCADTGLVSICARMMCVVFSRETPSRTSGVRFSNPLSSRRYLAGVPLPTLMLEFGHELLAVTQDYLADLRKPGEAKKAVADADFIRTPQVVRTGTNGD